MTLAANKIPKNHFEEISKVEFRKSIGGDYSPAPSMKNKNPL